MKRNSLVALATLACAIPTTARDLYVSPTGDDANPGTLAAPYRTVAKAAAVATAGDTCFFRAGTYQETLAPVNSGASGSPIVFQAYPNEKVVITAMQALSGWIRDTGSVYKTTVSWDLGQKNFVMNGLAACDLARWPNNTDADPWTQNSLRNTGGSASTVITDAYLDYAPGLPAVDWSKGGSLYFFGDKPGSGWTTWRAFIKSSTATRVTFDLDKNPQWIRTFHAPGDIGDFFLEGVREALDYANEWYFDSATLTLYLQIPGGGAPADGTIAMRRRTETIDLRNRSYIEVRNLSVFGGEIQISGSGNRLVGVVSLHGNRTRGVVTGFHGNSRSVEIRGSDHVLERCDIGFGSGTGVWDSGTNTRIANCYIHDFNYLGDYDAVVMVRDGGGGTQLLNNTIARGGRDAIQMLSNNCVVAYNDVSRSNLIADDCGLFYTGGGPHNIEIHHNWFHDAYSSGSKYKAAGIYLDTDPSGFNVHHNVIWNTEWTAVQINWNGKDLDIFNNTFWNNQGGAMGAWHKEGTAFSNVKVYNNLSNSSAWEPQADKQNNLTLSSGDPFLALASQDFRLRAGTTPIDAGRVITGITTGHVGAAPDIGAYESGGLSWTAGIDWDPVAGPVPVTGNSRLVNLSVRTDLAAGQLLIVGFYMAGTEKDLLLRAVGPGLQTFLDGFHPDPNLELFRDFDSIDTNDDWPLALAPVMTRVGAFPLLTGSKDAALNRKVSGSRTAWIRGKGQGVVLVEAYDAGTGDASKLINVSARNLAGTGNRVLIAGFVIAGDGPSMVLVRGVGPQMGKAPFNVPGVLTDPRIAIYNSTGTQIAENDNWDSSLAAVFTAVGAFQLDPGSKDAALRISLMPGAYTVHVSGADGGTGEALAEVYAVP